MGTKLRINLLQQLKIRLELCHTLALGLTSIRPTKCVVRATADDQ